MAEGGNLELQGTLDQTSAVWTIVPLNERVSARARQPLPAEPIRTLDAIHLATALLARTADPDLALLSLDRRIRKSARQSGMIVLPTDGEISPH